LLHVHAATPSTIAIAMIKEGLWAESAAPAGDIDLVGDADDGDVHSESPREKSAKSVAVK
jgi:hypothetical protein